jgi:hypothetical protein
LEIPLGRSHTTRFSNENLKIKIEENVREQDVFVVQTACPPLSEHIMELLIMLDALRHASAQRVTAVIPYFPYARSDKKDEPRISITARLMADLLAIRRRSKASSRSQPISSPPCPRFAIASARTISRTQSSSPQMSAKRRTQGASPSASICRSRSSTSAAAATTRTRARPT